MTPDRWKRLEEIYHSARGRDAAGRAAYLAEACAVCRAISSVWLLRELKKKEE